MSTLSTAVNNAQWELAAHLLILAALQTLSGDGTVTGPSRGPAPGPSAPLRTGRSRGGKGTDGTTRQHTARHAARR